MLRNQRSSDDPLDHCDKLNRTAVSEFFVSELISSNNKNNQNKSFNIHRESQFQYFSSEVQNIIKLLMNQSTAESAIQDMRIETAFKKIQQLFVENFEQTQLGLLAKDLFDINQSNKNHFLQELIFVFIHQSFLNENIVFNKLLSENLQTEFFKKQSQLLSLDNLKEKLEFLGDAIIEKFIVKKIIHLFPTLKEGELSQLKGKLVDANSLAQIAFELNFDKLFLLGKGEIKRCTHLGQNLLADSLEAVAAFLVFSTSESSVEKFLNEIFKTKLNELHQWYSTYSADHFQKLIIDPKSLLQQLCLKEFGTVPLYQVIEVGDDKFQIDFLINQKVMMSDIFTHRKDGMIELANKVLKEFFYKI